MSLIRAKNFKIKASWVSLFLNYSPFTGFPNYIRPTYWHNFHSEFFSWMELRLLPNAYRSLLHLLRIVALSRQPDLHGECTYGRLSTVWKAGGAKGHLWRLSPWHTVLFREKRGAWESFDRASSIENSIETVSSRGRIRYYYVLGIDFIETAKSTSPEHSALLRKLTRRIEFANRIGNARTSYPAISFSLRQEFHDGKRIWQYFMNCKN